MACTYGYGLGHKNPAEAGFPLLVQRVDFFELAALGWPDLPMLAASLEWAAIAGAAPVLLVVVDLAGAAFFAAAFSGAALADAALLTVAFLGLSFEEKIPVMLSMMDMANPPLKPTTNAVHGQIVPSGNLGVFFLDDRGRDDHRRRLGCGPTTRDWHRLGRGRDRAAGQHN